MNNENIMIDAVGSIDASHLEEYFERRKRRKKIRNNAIKISSVAASVLVILLAVLMVFPANNENQLTHRIPANTANNDTKKSTPIDSIREILYSDNYGSFLPERYLEAQSSFKEETNSPISEGNIGFQKPVKKEYDEKSGLYLIMSNADYLKEYTVAVSVTYTMETSSDEYTNSENVKKRGEEFLAKNGLKSSKITVIWEADGAAEETETYDILFINIEKLRELTAPEGINIKFSLIPSWLDTGESTIHKDISLRPDSLK